MKRIRFKGRLKEVRTKIGTNEIIAFEWAKLSENNYLLYLPKMFRKEEGGSFAIISEKKFQQMLRNNKKIEKDIEDMNKKLDSNL